MSGASIHFPGNDIQKSQTFTASGSFTVPAEVSIVVVNAIGAGGAGAHSTTSTGLQQGGGDGGYTDTRVVTVTPGASVTVTIGAGGVGVGAGSVHGADGGDTSFGSAVWKSGKGGYNNVLGGNQTYNSSGAKGTDFSKNVYNSGESARALGGVVNAQGGGGAGWGTGGAGATGDNAVGGTGGVGAGGGGNTSSGAVAGSGGRGEVVVTWVENES